MNVWEQKHPKLLDEGTRHRWRLEEEDEETSKDVVVREWKEERSLSTQTGQRVSIMVDKAIPAASAVFH